MARYSRIHLGPARKNDPQVHEAPASGATKPGSMVVLTGGKFALAGVASTGRVFIAQENYLAQKGVDTAYAADDCVLGLHPQDDTHYAAIIATGTNIAEVGTALSLAAGGKLAIAGGSARIVAFADEVYNNDTGVDQLIRIRVA